MIYKTDDVRISGIHEVQPPEIVHNEFPMTDAASETVYRTRDSIHKILHGEDDRLVVIVGSRRALGRAVHNATVRKRHTQLASRLRAVIQSSG